LRGQGHWKAAKAMHLEGSLSLSIKFVFFPLHGQGVAFASETRESHLLSKNQCRWLGRFRRLQMQNTELFSKRIAVLCCDTCVHSIQAGSSVPEAKKTMVFEPMSHTLWRPKG